MDGTLIFMAIMQGEKKAVFASLWLNAFLIGFNCCVINLNVM
jgi:hypothetical protein